jgi:hypothetical protein
MGGLFAGVERRLKASVLVVGDGGVVTHAGQPGSPLYGVPPEQRERWLAAMSEIEPIRFVGHASPAALLFQNGLEDQAVPVADATLYQQAGSEPKTIKWYAAGHGLNNEAVRDRVLWLQEQIGVNAARH